MRLSALGVLAAATALAPCADAATQELYLQSGGAYFSSPARVIAGYGGGPGFRHYLSDSVALHVELRWLGFLGNAWSLASGATHEWARGGWHPVAGLQLCGFFGDQLRIVDSSSPALPPPFALALQARLAPLHFVRGPASASALGVDVGAGFERDELAFALVFSLLEVGYRF